MRPHLWVKYIFSVKTLGAFLYADALFEHHAREKGRAADKFKTNDTTSSLGAMGDARKKMIADQHAKEAERYGDARGAAISAVVDLDVLLPPFNERYAASLHVKLAGERDASLPERFTDASSFRHKAGHSAHSRGEQCLRGPRHTDSVPVLTASSIKI